MNISRLLHFAPMPPERSGIADFTYELVSSLVDDMPSIVVSDTPGARVPPGAILASSNRVDTYAVSASAAIYQIGNNWGHTDIYRRAVTHPGIVVMHDLKLLYLVESLRLSPLELAAQMMSCNPRYAKARAMEVAFISRKLRSDYAMFDMAGTLLSNSLAIIVHSQFAKAMIARTYGHELAKKVHVTPHFAFPVRQRSKIEARFRLSVEPDHFLIVTCGFATEAKRFDWIISALDRIVQSRSKILWVQAGPVRPDEYDLQKTIKRFPRVQAVTRLTGFLTEDELMDYVVASDVVVNLRFPSVGESSGIVSRALPSGACCIVADTAAYSEYPDNVVIKIDVKSPVASLTNTLLCLSDSPGARAAYGENAKEYSKTALSIAEYKSTIMKILSKIAATPLAVRLKTSHDIQPLPRRLTMAPPIASLQAAKGELLQLRIGPLSESDLWLGSLGSHIPQNFLVHSSRLIDSDCNDASEVKRSSGVFLELLGIIQ